MSTLLGLIYLAAVLISVPFLANLVQNIWGGGKEFSDPAMMLGSICTLVVVIGIIRLIESERQRAKTKGRECRAVFLDGLPDLKREQMVHLTLDVKNRIVLIDGLKGQDPALALQGDPRINRSKEAHISLDLQQIVRLNYVYWEGDVLRWMPGSNGYSYPGFFAGTRVYEAPTPGYSYTETLKVDGALEIRYRSQAGPPERIVLDISGDSYYAQSLLETLCRYTGLSAPQYIPPVRPGPAYL